MPGVVDDLEELVMASVALTARMLAEVAPELTLLQWRTLVVLDAPQDGEAVSVGGLAVQLGASLSATSRVVSRLERRGFVHVAKSRSDQRVREVRLTPEGRLLHETVVQHRRVELRRVVAGTSPDDASAIRRMARALWPPTDRRRRSTGAAAHLQGN